MPETLKKEAAGAVGRAIRTTVDNSGDPRVIAEAVEGGLVALALILWERRAPGLKRKTFRHAFAELATQAAKAAAAEEPRP